jgi:hypothetical protein
VSAEAEDWAATPMGWGVAQDRLWHPTHPPPGAEAGEGRGAAFGGRGEGGRWRRGCCLCQG